MVILALIALLPHSDWEWVKKEVSLRRHPSLVGMIFAVVPLNALSYP